MMRDLWIKSRGKAKMGYQIPYSPEAEKLVFHLIDNEWDLLSSKIHPVAIKWFFQQEKISTPMLSQILNFCILTCPYGAHIIVQDNQNGKVDVIFFCRVGCSRRQLRSKTTSFSVDAASKGRRSSRKYHISIDSHGTNHKHLPRCLGSIVHAWYRTCNPQIVLRFKLYFVTCTLLIFNILRSVKPELLSNHEVWLLLTTKLLEVLIPTMAEGTCKQEGILVMGIFSLVLHLSTMEAFKEASLVILVNTSLISAINNIVYTSCSKGPALVDHDENTEIGGILICVLLLYLCSLKSMHALPAGTLGWRSNLEPTSAAKPLI